MTQDDRSFALLFATIGQCHKRLPIRWIEMGDVVEMSRRFSSGVLNPHLPPPQPGDPRIKVENKFPGMLFATSDTDVDDLPTDDENDKGSDDEAAQFEFAPPVSMLETVMEEHHSMLLQDRGKLNA